MGNSKQKQIPEIVDLSSKTKTPSAPKTQNVKVRDVAISKSETKQVKTMKNNKEKSDQFDTTDAMMKQYEKVKAEAAKIEQNAQQKTEVKEKTIYKTESERYIAEINELKRAMEEKTLHIEELERE